MKAILPVIVAVSFGLMEGSWSAERRDAPSGEPSPAVPMANPYPYAFFDPAKPSPQIVAPPRDWTLNAAAGWEWNSNALLIWPENYGIGPWGPWWGPGWRLSWGPPWSCAGTKEDRLKIKIRF